MSTSRSIDSQTEIEALRRELEEAKAVIGALHKGEADALVVDTAGGPRVYTLRSADEPYRTIVETLREGAITTTGDGVVLYCNDAFARLVGCKASALIGTSLKGMFEGASFDALVKEPGASGLECALITADGRRLECQVSSTPHQSDSRTIWCLLVTDLTGQTLRLRHNAIVQSTSDAVISFDRDGRLTTWNPAAEALFGYTAVEAIGQPADLLMRGLPRIPEGETARGAFDLALAGQQFRKDTQRVAKDGTVIDVAVTASPVRAPDGAVTGVCAIMRDIRERKKAEARIARDFDAMRRLQKLGTLHVRDSNLGPILNEILDAAIAIAGADFGNIQLLRRESGKLRIEAQRGFPRWWVDFWHSADAVRSACAAALERNARIIVEDVETDPLFAGTPALDVQRRAGVRAVQSVPLVSRSGAQLGVFSTHYKAPHRPGPRELALLELLAQEAADIIARTQADVALRESEARLRAFLNATSDVVYRMSRDWKEMRQLQGRHFIADTLEPSRAWLDKYIHPDDRQLVLDRIEQAITSKSIFELEHRVLREDGSLGWTYSRAIPILDEQGEIVEWFGAASEVTQRKAAEAAAINSWVSFTALEYGSSWADFRIAIEKTMRCGANAPNNFACDLDATPCRPY